MATGWLDQLAADVADAQLAIGIAAVAIVGVMLAIEAVDWLRVIIEGRRIEREDFDDWWENGRR